MWGLDLGGFFEDSDTTCSTFGLIPKSPNWRFVRGFLSPFPFEGDLVGTTAAFLNEMALKSANRVPKNTKPTTVCITLTNKSESQNKMFKTS